MKFFFTLCILLISCTFLHAQQRKIDSLVARLKHTSNWDSTQHLVFLLNPLLGGSSAVVQEYKLELTEAETAGNKEIQEHCLLALCVGMGFERNEAGQLQYALKDYALAGHQR